MTLRPYQQEAVNAAKQWLRTSLDPCVIQAPTGSGKSHVIAALASWLHSISGGKHVLCLAPSAELVHQNKAKFEATGNPASVFSATAGGRSLRHPVVFGTPTTVRNKIRRFGEQFCSVIIDEAHGLTPTIRSIIEHIRSQNPRLRVIGLSATPYRLGTGYIFQMDEQGQPTGIRARDPYFTARVYTIHERELITQGYLTPPVIGQINGEHYDTLSMELNRSGQFSAKDIDKAYHGHGRKTSRIVADIVAQSQDRRGVIIFAATRQHAAEVLASLPPALSACVTGDTPKDKRKQILSGFLSHRIKYLVNVSVLTTGFDAPHVDVVALLRATESVSLLQQMIGRGLRIAPDKSDCLVLDYAENIERHCPDGDLFSPDIKAHAAKGEQETIKAICPACRSTNEFAARPNPDGFKHDDEGYFIDLAGARVTTDEGDMPAHFGRRCYGMVKQGSTYERCEYRWTGKQCPACYQDNDIAARYCSDCKHELVDPNEKLRSDFQAFKRDPHNVQTDEVLSMQHTMTLSRNGNEVIRCTFTTPYRSFTVWFSPTSKAQKAQKAYRKWRTATNLGALVPNTVTYYKERNSKWYHIVEYNEEVDQCNSQTG